VAGTTAASLFRVPNDEANLPPTVLGFAVVAALTMVVCSIVGLADTPTAESFGRPSESFIQVTDSASSVLTLLLALIAVGGTVVMFRAGREHISEAFAPSTTEPPKATVRVSREPAPAAPLANPAAATSAQVSRRDSDDDPVKRCPECAEWVKDAANVCRYCGFRFVS
jgi:hypothetical protein